MRNSADRENLSETLCWHNSCVTLNVGQMIFGGVNLTTIDTRSSRLPNMSEEAPTFPQFQDELGTICALLPILLRSPVFFRPYIIGMFRRSRPTHRTDNDLFSAVFGNVAQVYPPGVFAFFAFEDRHPDGLIRQARPLKRHQTRTWSMQLLKRQSVVISVRYMTTFVCAAVLYAGRAK